MNVEAPGAVLNKSEPSPTIAETAVAQTSEPVALIGMPQPIDPEKRIYIAKTGENVITVIRDLKSNPVTKEEVKLLGVTLGLLEWDSLNLVLKAFRMQLQYDVRMSDLLGRWMVDNKGDISVDMTFDEAAGYAFITIFSGDGMSRFETRHRLVFKMEGEHFLPQCLFQYDNDYSEAAPEEGIQNFGGRDWYVWKGLTGHGTGYSKYEKKWFDLTTGALMLSVAVSEGDSNWDDISYSLHESVSEDVMSAEAGFVVTAKCNMEVAPYQDDSWKPISHEIQYKLWYDAGQNKFYTSVDPYAQCYLEFSQSEDERITKWAKRRLSVLDVRQADKPEERFYITNRSEHNTFGLIKGSGDLDKKALETLFAEIEKSPSNIGEIFYDHYMYIEYGKRLMDADYFKTKNITCTLDFDTAREHQAYLGLYSIVNGKRRAALIVFVLNEDTTSNGADFISYSASAIITYTCGADEAPSLSYSQGSLTLSIPEDKDEYGEPDFEQLIIYRGKCIVIPAGLKEVLGARTLYFCPVDEAWDLFGRLELYDKDRGLQAIPIWQDAAWEAVSPLYTNDKKIANLLRIPANIR